MIGCCEALEYIGYVATSVVSLGDMIVEPFPSLEAHKPLIWAVFYISAVFIHIPFWYFNRFAAFLSLSMLFLYIFGSLPHIDVEKYALAPNLGFVGGVSGFMRVLPLAAWFFVGVESLSMSSDQVKNPKWKFPLAKWRVC